MPSRGIASRLAPRWTAVLEAGFQEIPGECRRIGACIHQALVSDPARPQRPPEGSVLRKGLAGLGEVTEAPAAAWTTAVVRQSGFLHSSLQQPAARRNGA